MCIQTVKSKLTVTKSNGTDLTAHSAIQEAAAPVSRLSSSFFSTLLCLTGRGHCFFCQY